MDTDARRRVDIDIKKEDDAVSVQSTSKKPTYRSWKKKYHKILTVFDEKMKTNEELLHAEQRALATAKRIAIHNDRLLDLLLDVNDSGQMPSEKRYDLSLDLLSDEEALCLDIDQPSTPPSDTQPLKSYKKILREVPHITYANAAKHFPELIADLEAGRDSPADPQQGAPHPPSFLTADDIDNYIYEIDSRIFPEDSNPLPTMAPLAHPDENPSRDTTRDFALRNPVSVYGWLRGNAPNTFLQDGEHHDKESNKDKEDKNGDDHHLHPQSTSGRSRAKGERAPRGSGANRSKRTSAAALRAAPDSFEDEDGLYDTPVATPSATGTTKGKRKRVADDDPGYRPKGGSSRPTKKKRKSDGGGLDGTPTASSKRARKSGGGDTVMKDD